MKPGCFGEAWSSPTVKQVPGLLEEMLRFENEYEAETKRRWKGDMDACGESKSTLSRYNDDVKRTTKVKPVSKKQKYDLKQILHLDFKAGTKALQQKDD